MTVYDTAKAPDARQPSHTDKCLSLVRELGGRIFSDTGGDEFIAFPGGRSFRVEGKRFGKFLRHLVKKHDLGFTLSDASVKAVQAELAAEAFDATARDIFVRVGRVDDVVYLDLADREGHVVEITRGGWRVMTGAECPVHFRRPPAMRSLPLPDTKGRLDEFRRHLGLTDDDNWALLAPFLVSVLALAPRGPYPIAYLFGEQGSSKTSATEMCSELTDPRQGGVRAPPTDNEGLAIAAENGHLLAFDNVSEIDKAMSDSFARVSTGAGFATRTHYENREECVFDFARPVIMNGIGHAVVRADLADRLLNIELPVIPPSQRKTKRALLEDFRKSMPRILGGLCSAVCLALERSAEVERALRGQLPRMADFAVVAVAAEGAYGVPPGTFLAAYTRSQAAGAEAAAGADPVASALVPFLRPRRRWSGSATDLLEQLPRPDFVRASQWPGSATAMGSQLARMRPTLSALGIAASCSRSGRERRWTLEITRHLSSAPSPESSNDDAALAQSDARDARTA
jgi:hypothetical protein